MDVDTPPRPQQPPLSNLPPSATTSTIPLPPSAAQSPPTPTDHLDFDSSTFEPTAAFGVEEEHGEHSAAGGSTEDGDKSLTLISGFKGESGHASADVRRRRGTQAGARRKQESDSRDREEDEQVDDDVQGGVMGILKSKMGGMKGSEFNFQVHHHHGAGGALAGFDNESAPSRWFHSQTPYTLLGYLQFASLTLLSLLFLSLSLLFLYTLYTDIKDRLSSLTTEMRAEILQCAKAYVDNRCAPQTRMPALARQCSGWEECMGRDPNLVGRTRVVAETLAEVVNGFVDVISFKTMLFVMAILSLTIYGSSVALSALPVRPTPTAAPPSPSFPPHFQHLGYHPSPSPYGYPPVNAYAGNGWEGPAGLGLGAPETRAEPMGRVREEEKVKGKKSWF
ncbi:hypothetical protein P7C70_g4389, partial [Phenoliferia sp. Uapishka_3]